LPIGQQLVLEGGYGGISPYSKVYIIASDIFVIFYKLTNLLNRDWMRAVMAGQQIPY